MIYDLPQSTTPSAKMPQVKSCRIQNRKKEMLLNKGFEEVGVVLMKPSTDYLVTDNYCIVGHGRVIWITESEFKKMLQYPE